MNVLWLVMVADLCGTFVFSVEGALAAVHHNLDFLGVMVLGFSTALGGGVIRDVLIGATPPSAIRDWHYTLVAFIAAALTFFFAPALRLLPHPVLIALDAAGLSLFAVAGTEKALAFGIHPFSAVLMGTITGVGGGTLRDLLLAQVPAVLRVDIYATAALFGAVIVVAGRALKARPALVGMAGGIGCFVLRLVSVWQHWHLPIAMSG
jgi:uncharacterized membrane protein YeiH